MSGDEATTMPPRARDIQTARAIALVDDLRAQSAETPWLEFKIDNSNPERMARTISALANAARMLKGNPELMNLRLLQVIAGGPGKQAATVVLGGGSGLLPVSNNGEAPSVEE